MPPCRPQSIVNLTPYELTRQMRDKGVFDLPTVERRRVMDMLDAEPSQLDADEIRERAESIARIADSTGADRACVHVPIAFVSALEAALRERNIRPMYPEGEMRKYQEETPVDDVDRVKLGFRIEEFVEPPDPRETRGA